MRPHMHSHTLAHALHCTAQVFQYLDSKREQLKLTFRYYLSRSMYRTERVEFTVSTNQMSRLLSGTRVPGPGKRREYPR